MTPQEALDAKRLSRVIRAGRKILGKTQTEVARDIEITQGAFSKIESAQLIPSASQWFALCRSLNIDPVETFHFGFIDNMIPANLQAAYPDTTFKVSKRYSRNQGSKVRAIRPFIRFFQESLGSAEFEAYCDHAQVDSDFFIVYDNQLSLGFSVDLIDTMVNRGKLKKKDLPKLVKPVSLPLAHGGLRRSYDQASSQTGLMTMALGNASKYETNFNYKIEETSRNGLVFSITPNESLQGVDYKKESMGDFLCQYKQAYFKQLASYKPGSPVAEITEKECHFHGASKCVYRMKLAS